jgi:hypothetical protein
MIDHQLPVNFLADPAPFLSEYRRMSFNYYSVASAKNIPGRVSRCGYDAVA